ncbi:MAG: diphthine--ammonia ligase [Candidatus Hodarchaeota archaeon]
MITEFLTNPNKLELMKLGVLFSGGKDSTYALFKAMEKETVVCLISIFSKNKESYMFHTPNIHITELQARSIGLPLIQKSTEGRKEEELKDLKQAIKKAKETLKIEGVVTGAVESIYQTERIQKICDTLDLQCFNPLWLKNQIELLEEIVESGFEVIISGIFAYPLDKKWLGREIDNQSIKELVLLQEKYHISPSGEGGEIETTVLDAPFFQKRIEIQEFEIQADENSGIFLIKKARLVDK